MDQDPPLSITLGNELDRGDRVQEALERLDELLYRDGAVYAQWKACGCDFAETATSLDLSFSEIASRIASFLCELGEITQLLDS